MSDVKVTSFVPEAINGNTEGTLKGMLATAIRVTTQAKKLAPVDKGQLKGSIMWKSSTGRGGITDGKSITEDVKPNEIIVGTATEHGVYQEFGTRKMPGQPFLRPAVEIVTRGTSGSKAMANAIENTVKRKL